MRCNVCWLQLSHADKVCATQCSHVLCSECTSKYLGRTPRTCPVCGTGVEEMGLAWIDLVPSSDKIKALCGLDPSFILQVASRAIDFYNFQSELAHTHDAQELESAKRNFQHQTQQNALAQKDLNSQLRTLKYQLEAIVSERDAQVRLVHELQSRLDHFSSPVSSFPSSSLSTSLSAPSPPSNPHHLPSPTNSHAPLPAIAYSEPENRPPNNLPLSLGTSPYRTLWTSPHALPPHRATFNKADDAHQATIAPTERRTRIFSTHSPASHRRLTQSPTQERALTGANQVLSPYQVTTTAPKHHTHTFDSVPSSSASAPSRPTHAAHTNGSGHARFISNGNNPTRPETPLLQRLSGLSSNRPHG